MSYKVLLGHHGDVVEGKVQAQRLVCYHGNAGESAVGAVTAVMEVASSAGRPPIAPVDLLTPDQRDQQEEQGQGDRSQTSHAAEWKSRSVELSETQK